METDNYCENENGNSANIQEVGMQALLLSGVYGAGATSTSGAVSANCDVSGTPTPANLRPSGCTVTYGATNPCSSCSTGTFSAATPALSPWKPKIKSPNHIGFTPVSGSGTCSGTRSAGRSSLATDIAVGSASVANCTLGEISYNLGVGGYLGGSEYIGFQIANSGVVTEQTVSTTANLLSVGICK